MQCIAPFLPKIDQILGGSLLSVNAHMLHVYLSGYPDLNPLFLLIWDLPFCNYDVQIGLDLGIVNLRVCKS